MTEEEVRQLIKEHAELKEEAARKERRIEELEGLLMSALLRIEELERRLAKDSHNSSKPPSSDSLKRKGKQRQTSSKPKGGQAGHPGHALQLVEIPDQVITHRPSHCEVCHCELPQHAGQVKERWQIHELPVMRLISTFGRTRQTHLDVIDNRLDTTNVMRSFLSRQLLRIEIDPACQNSNSILNGNSDFVRLNTRIPLQFF